MIEETMTTEGNTTTLTLVDTTKPPSNWEVSVNVDGSACNMQLAKPSSINGMISVETAATFAEIAARSVALMAEIIHVDADSVISIELKEIA